MQCIEFSYTFNENSVHCIELSHKTREFDAMHPEKHQVLLEVYENSMQCIEFSWKYTRTWCTSSSSLRSSSSQRTRCREFSVSSFWEPATTSSLLVCFGQRTPRNEFFICATMSSHRTQCTASSSLSIVGTRCTTSSSLRFYFICHKELDVMHIEFSAFLFHLSQRTRCNAHRVLLQIYENLMHCIDASSSLTNMWELDALHRVL